MAGSRGRPKIIPTRGRQQAAKTDPVAKIPSMRRGVCRLHREFNRIRRTMPALACGSRSGAGSVCDL